MRGAVSGRVHRGRLDAVGNMGSNRRRTGALVGLGRNNMPELVPIGPDSSGQCRFFVLAVDSVARLPHEILFTVRRFECLLAWDASNEPVEVIADVAR